MASKYKNINPKSTDVDHYSQNIIVDYSFKTIWVSTSIDKFTNYICDKDEFFKFHYMIFSKLTAELSSISRKELRTRFPHSRNLNDNDIKKIMPILRALLKKQNETYTEKDITDAINQNISEEQLFQIGHSSVRMIGYFNKNIFKVLFFDYYHLINSDQHYNDHDYSKYDFCVYSEGKLKNG